MKRWFLGLAAALIVGCGQSAPRLTTYPVHGKVMTADGQPVRWAIICFQPDGSGADCEGIIKDDGTFSVGTYHPRKDPDGALPGKYKVYIEPFSEERFIEARNDVKPTTIPAKYQEAKTSGWSVEIKAGDNDLELLKFE